ncbi:MAG: toxic anion resistance protein [Atopobiaceae bacterium]|nr:toxic anion resistance protein [Atopobiaceae bacterium]MBR1828451.1 toxic anion resistance protein [Atopobiaceae bacterium]
MDSSTLDYQDRETSVLAQASNAALQTVREGERLARTVMEVDLADQASRMRARRTVDQFGEGGTSATRSRMLGKQLRSLAWADASSSKAMADMQRLASKVRQLGISRDRARPGLVRRLLGLPDKKKFESLSASREEIEGLVASLSGSAEVLRQNSVALDGFESDIRDEREQITKDIALADAFESALVDAVGRAKADQRMSDVVRFVENEVLYHLEQQRSALQTLNAVNQQAAMSLSILRETNDALVQNMQLVTVATRHALDVAALLQRSREVHGEGKGATDDDASADTGALQDSLNELMRALDRHEAWRTGSAARRENAFHELQSISERASCDDDYA